MFEKSAPRPAPSSEADRCPLDAPESIALRRLIEEVRSEGGIISPTAYNRTYHRHNR